MPIRSFVSFRIPSVSFCLALAAAIPVATAAAQNPAVASSTGQPAPATANPYRLEPFHADFPIALEYPPHVGAEYARTRRQMLERLAANLQGNVRREAWQLATEFFWRAPEDAAEPLVEAMDRAFGKAGLDDVVKNCIDAMGRMGLEVFDTPLRRTLHHPNPVVQQAGFAALARCGKVETLRELASAFTHMDGRARSAWMRAVRLRLGDEGTQILKAVMAGPYPANVRDEVLKEALQLPHAAAAEVLRVRWDEAVGEFKAIIAGVLHAAGDAAGTVWLRESLTGEDVGRLVLAVKHSGHGAIGDLREPLLRASAHLRSEVRFEVAKALIRLEGDDIVGVYETLIAPEEAWEVRAIALRELTRRGQGQAVSVLLDELPTASGTRLVQIVNQLSASGDPRAVPVLLERFQKAPPGEGRPFVQALALNASEAAAKALFEIYKGPDKLVARGSAGELTTRSYLPTLFLNLRGSERVILDGYRSLPKSEWRLRAPLLTTLTGIASDRSDTALHQPFVEPVREVLFDREELPQMRVLALNQLTLRWLTLDDALRLKNTHRTESPQLRALFADFLNDCF